MPFYRMYLPSGLNDRAVEKSLQEITTATADTLENTLPRMVRIGIYESEPEKIYKGGKTVDRLTPTVIFNCGPGRSLSAKHILMEKVAAILSDNLGCEKENVRCHLLDNWDGHHLMIDGKPKDFSKKVNLNALHV